MTTYNFSQISPFEFEELCRDLLQAELGRTLELFAPGPDRGIDIRHLGAPDDEEGTFIAQCKRWDEGAYAALLSHLKRDELPKIEKLAPDRYILMTSVRLTPDRKDEIVKALKPWIHGPADVYGRDDLSGLLARHQEVERRHIKLWLTSTEVLDALLNSNVATRSEAAIEHAQRQLRLWVPNPSFDRAWEMLDGSNVCVISGAPGIGKTMLADILMAGYASEGYEPVVISEDIDEGDRAWRSKRRQVFHYDDFLGHVTYGELQLRKNEESRLAKFVDRVRRSDGKKFILTTREYILTEALNRYENIASVNIERHKSLVKLEDYTPLIRAKILYNHLVFSDIPAALKCAMLPGRKYRDVISHRNYSPRIVDHAINIVDNRNSSTEDFISNFFAVLDDPSEVWGRIFINLPKAGQRLLLVVATLPPQVLLDDVRFAVHSLVGDGFDAIEFRQALEMLEGTLIDISEGSPGGRKRERILSIRDPSVHDYLWGRLESLEGEAETLLDSAVFFEQCVALYEGTSHAATRAEVRPRGTRRARVVMDHEAIANKAVNLITSSNPRLVRVSGTVSEAFTREYANVELRAAFVARLLAENRASRESATAAGSALSAACDTWEVGRGSPSDGITLLRVAKRVEQLFPDQLIARAEEALFGLIVGRLDDVEGFVALVDMYELSPRLFAPPHHSLGFWEEQFAEFVEQEKGWWLGKAEDPDWIEQDMEMIENVASVLGNNLGNLLDDAFERTEELRQAVPDYEDDDDWRKYRTEHSGTTEEIDALFQALLVEQAET